MPAQIGCLRWLRLWLEFDDRLEPAPEHSLAVEWHGLWIHHAGYSRIFITLALTRSR